MKLEIQKHIHISTVDRYKRLNCQTLPDQTRKELNEIDACRLGELWSIRETYGNTYPELLEEVIFTYLKSERFLEAKREKQVEAIDQLNALMSFFREMDRCQDEQDRLLDISNQKL